MTNPGGETHARPGAEVFVQWLTPEPPVSASTTGNNPELNPYVLHYGYEETFRTFYWELINPQSGEVVTSVGSELEPIDNPFLLADGIAPIAGMTPAKEVEVVRNLTHSFMTKLATTAGADRERLPNPESYRAWHGRSAEDARVMISNVSARAHAADEVRSLIPSLNLDHPMMVRAFWNSYERRIRVHTPNTPIIHPHMHSESEPVDLDNMLASGEDNASSFGY